MVDLRFSFDDYSPSEMEKRVERELYLLDEAVRLVANQGRALASCVNGGADLIEDLQQITVALHYEVEVLKGKLVNITLVGKS